MLGQTCGRNRKNNGLTRFRRNTLEKERKIAKFDKRRFKKPMLSNRELQQFSVESVLFSRD